MKYKIINKVVEYHFVSETTMNENFNKYQCDETLPTDILMETVVVDELFVDETKADVVSETYSLVNSPEVIYSIKENDIYIGEVICDDDKGYYKFRIRRDVDPFYIEYLLVQAAFSRYYTTHYEALFIHSSCVGYKDKCFLLSALSGTGKSTHANLWQKYYGAIRINDDKNFIVYEDGTPYVYGTPISGKHFLDTNTKAELVGIVFLYQNKENVIRRLSPFEVLTKLMCQIQIPYDETSKERFSMMLDRLLTMKCYELGCTISKEAVDLVKNALFKEE